MKKYLVSGRTLDKIIRGVNVQSFYSFKNILSIFLHEEALWFGWDRKGAIRKIAESASSAAGKDRRP